MGRQAEPRNLSVSDMDRSALKVISFSRAGERPAAKGRFELTFIAESGEFGSVSERYRRDVGQNGKKAKRHRRENSAV